jgi:hypothetical protein
VTEKHTTSYRLERRSSHRALHERVNRWLASVALLLSIAALAVFLTAAASVYSGLDSLRDSFGGSSTPATECWDPGGGEVCAPGGEDGK